MNREEYLALIRQKCVEANPELDTVYDLPRPIRLADVLCALRPLQGSLAIDKDGLFVIPTIPQLGGWVPATTINAAHPFWNIYRDDLTEQSDECIAFLYSLLK